MNTPVSKEEIFKRHEGGKVAIRPLVDMSTVEDLRIFYTPGVAEVCRKIVDQPESVREYTALGRTVCIATNGSAVLGLGDIGARAGLPVMEGKSLILHNMAGVSCVPLLIESAEAETIIETLVNVAPSFGAIMIEDIKAPLCFEVEKGLQERLSIPVFHDDQHGTAIVALAGLIRALKMTGRSAGEVKVVINGAGAGGLAVCRTLLEYGFEDIILCDSRGAIYEGRTDGMNPYKEEIARKTNRERMEGNLSSLLKGRDIFIGLSMAGLVTQDMVRSMNADPIVFALANPEPEIWPDEALAAGAVVASDGRTINNCLAFPGLMKGALNSGARAITSDMRLATARAIADLAPDDELVPDFMDSAVHQKVIAAVEAAARDCG
ncbi:MAG: NADP-dependent malic enzyme [Candidatus Omnitrophota bacterium]